MTQPFAAESAACRAAQEAWASTPVRARLAVIREARFLLVERRQAVTAAVHADTGRDEAEVLATDVLPTATAARFLCDSAERLLRPRRVGWAPVWLMGARDTVHRRPRGVVGLIGTWNYPVFLNAVPLLHALTAGNGVLWKPSELAPRTAEILANLLADAGVPAGLVRLLPATRDAGPQLAEADIDCLHFTGSDRVGRRLAARLGERLIPSVLELSGCDALIVRPDADLALAARSAWYAVTLNAGQTCLATRRMFVPRPLLADFLQALRPHVERSRPARLLTAHQREQTARMLAEAAVAGCAVLTSNTPAGPNEIAPALVVDAPPGLSLCREAAFAPVAAVLTYADDAELFRLDAACPFALGAAVFGHDTRAACELAGKLRAGAVTVNDVLVPTAHPATPFGGRGASGWGVTQGAEGLLDMTVPQVVTTRRGTFRPHVDAGLTPNPASARMVDGLLLATHGRTLRDRWRGVRTVIASARAASSATPTTAPTPPTLPQTRTRPG